MTLLRTGDTAARSVSGRIAAPGTLAAFSAFGIANAADGQLALDSATGKKWRFSAACTLTADNILVAGSGTGNGRWLLLPGSHVLYLPISAALADAAVIWTVPTGALFNLRSMWWKTAVDWTGGSSSAIGISSTRTNFTTKGDLLGGAGGDVLATLTAALSPNPGTIGAKLDALTNAEVNALWSAGHVFRYDEITSAFTAGSGFAAMAVQLHENAGA